MALTDNIPSIDRKGLRSFGLTTGALIAGLFGLLLPYLFDLGFPLWPWVVFGVLGGWALIAPGTLKPVYFGWMVFALILNKITTPIVMGLVFFVVLFPMSLVLRLLRKDALNRKFNEEVTSYRVASVQQSMEHFERPF